MALRVTVTVTGDENVMRKLRALGSGITMLRPAMIQIGKDATKYYESVGFSDQGRPWGNPWPPLAGSTKRWKEKKYPGRPTLVATGRMQQGFTAEATEHSVTIGNTAPYYKYHQSSAPRSKLPRRQMAGINNPIKRMVRDAIQHEIRRKIQAA